jgi:hypothetical protein
MPKFATGKYSKAISDRSGLAFPYNEMVFEWNGSFKTGSSGSSTITVTERTHGRSSSDTVRFRDVNSFDGITKTNLENSSGYSITKVDDDTYTFSVSTDTATTGNIRGGGDRATAGPATIEN